MACIQVVIVIAICATLVISKDIAWQKPGCHKVGMWIVETKKSQSKVWHWIFFLFLSVIIQLLLYSTGHSRTIEIPDCVQFSINTNACRGYCESYAVPSAPNASGYKIPKPVTSVGQCCNIMETEDVNVMLSCVGGARNVTFKSATKCSCYHCKKD